MNYCSKTTVESALFPGVSYVIRKMTERRRVQREMTIAPLRMKVNEGSAAIKTALDDAANQPAGMADKLNREFGLLLHTEWYPAWIRWGVASIDNFEIDGDKATVESTIESGPTELLEEMFLAVLAGGLTPVEEKNSLPPGTSDAQADGKTSDSTAPPATSLDGGKIETAESITPVI
jgi:hypothetical protein